MEYTPYNVNTIPIIFYFIGFIRLSTVFCNVSQKLSIILRLSVFKSYSYWKPVYAVIDLEGALGDRVPILFFYGALRVSTTFYFFNFQEFNLPALVIFSKKNMIRSFKTLMY